MRGLFPEGEPGDWWRWAALAVLAFIAFAVLNSRMLRPVTYLVQMVGGTALLVLVVVGLVTVLR